MAGRILPRRKCQKTLNYCHENGQRPPLSPFCNMLIITAVIQLNREFPLMQCEQRANHTLDYDLPITGSILRLRTVFEPQIERDGHVGVGVRTIENSFI